MDHAALIEALGGPDFLAQAFGCHRTGVVRWRTRGIPPARFPDVVALAASRQVSVTLEALYAGLPPRTPRPGGPGKFRHTSDAAWADLYEKGWPLKRIAAHFGAAHETVRQHLLRQGITMRPASTRAPA